MIPKKIHYCWFGKGKKNELLEECIKSWSKYGFEIIEWNESNYDLNHNFYLKENYKNKNWAYVSDYVRLDVLYNYGGIYLDTDEKILKELPNEFFEYDACFGFLFDSLISGGMIASQKKNKLIEELLVIYGELTDIKTLNNQIITDFFLKIPNFKLNGKSQELVFREEKIKIYSKKYFSIPSIFFRKDNYMIHYFSNSWKVRKNEKIKKILLKLIGDRVYYNLLAYKALLLSPYFNRYKEDSGLK